MRILDCKNERCSGIASEVGSIDPFLCDECSEHFEAVKTSLDELSIPYVIDPAIVRGFDYYTKTVFEFVAEGIGAQDAIRRRPLRRPH